MADLPISAAIFFCATALFYIGIGVHRIADIMYKERGGDGEDSNV